MNSNTYIKKPIIEPNRICALKECSKPFIARRQDQVYCKHSCGEKAWRIKHPRKTHYKHSSYESKEICSARDVRRDTPERLTRYLQANPFYLPEDKTIKQFVSEVFR